MQIHNYSKPKLSQIPYHSIILCTATLRVHRTSLFFFFHAAFHITFSSSINPSIHHSHCMALSHLPLLHFTGDREAALPCLCLCQLGWDALRGVSIGQTDELEFNWSRFGECNHESANLGSFLGKGKKTSRVKTNSSHYRDFMILCSLTGQVI